MGYSGGIIVNEVGMGDISTALGYSSLDLGTLAQYAYQNRWAKCKAFAYGAWYFASSYAEQSARASKNCGLVMYDYGNNWTLYAAMVSNGSGVAAWKHDVPTGGSSAPFRMLDYLGYNTASAAPFQFGLFPNPAHKMDNVRISDEGGAGIADIDAADLQGDGTFALNHSGYKYHNINSLNVGVMYGTSTTQPSAAYTLGPISSWTPHQNIPKPSSTGDYYTVTFFTDKTFDGDATSTNGIFIPAPVGMTIWHYDDSLGLTYGNTELNAVRTSLHMYIGTISGTQSYYKLTVVIVDGSTRTVDLNSGQAGTLTTTITDFGSITLSPAVSQNAAFYLRFWITSVNWYEERFYPMETPTI